MKKKIDPNYNAKAAVFQALLAGRKISLLNSSEFYVGEMHTVICKIRQDIERKNLPYVMCSEWFTFGSHTGESRAKRYWLEVKINKGFSRYE